MNLLLTDCILYSQVRATSVLQNLIRIKQDLLNYGVASPTGSSHWGKRATDGKLMDDSRDRLNFDTSKMNKFHNS